MSMIDTSGPGRTGPGIATGPGAETAAALAAFGFDPEMAERLLVPQRQLAEVALQMTQEMMDFANRRMRAQVEFMDALRRCDDFNGVVEAQLRFVAQTSSDFADEISHLVQVARVRMEAETAAKTP